MTSNNFNESANPLLLFFGARVEGFIAFGESITEQHEQALDIIAQKQTMSRDEYQFELEDSHHYLIQTMDSYLSDLNYFKLLEQFERLKLLKRVKPQIDARNVPALKTLETDEAIDKEIGEAIDSVFETLQIIRDEMLYEEKITDMPNAPVYADIFTETKDERSKFLEKDDMNDRMEFVFWVKFLRRLGVYEISEDMASDLDEIENDPEERLDRLCSFISGQEQEKFPVRMCTLDGFSEKEIETAKQMVENDRIEAESEAEKDDNEVDTPDDDASHNTRPDSGASEKPAKNKKADVIPIDRFRKPKREP